MWEKCGKNLVTKCVRLAWFQRNFQLYLIILCHIAQQKGSLSFFLLPQTVLLPFNGSFPFVNEKTGYYFVIQISMDNDTVQLT